jgi:ribonuclease VapC
LIVVDTSAVIAMILHEANAQTLTDRLFAAEERYMSAMSVVEATLVLSRTSSEPASDIKEFMSRADVKLCAVDQEHVTLAQRALLNFGKGRHQATLNLADCFSYAAAKALDAPLLSVGNDFNQTDVRVA